MFGIDEDKKMWYYVVEEGVCIYFTNSLRGVNSFVYRKDKRIINTYKPNEREIIIEVF